MWRANLYERATTGNNDFFETLSRFLRVLLRKNFNKTEELSDLEWTAFLAGTPVNEHYAHYVLAAGVMYRAVSLPRIELEPYGLKFIAIAVRSARLRENSQRSSPYDSKRPSRLSTAVKTTCQYERLRVFG